MEVPQTVCASTPVTMAERENVPIPKTDRRPEGALSCLGPAMAPEHHIITGARDNTRSGTKILSQPLQSASHTSPTVPDRDVVMSKPSIPAWQRTATTDPPSLSADEQPKPENAAEDSTKPVAEEPGSVDATGEDLPSTDLLEQARRFLEDDNIRDAPRERKAVFLQAKGVSPDDIETLLGKAIPENASPDLEAAGARAWSTVSVLRCIASSRPRAVSWGLSRLTTSRHRQSQPKGRLHLRHSPANYRPSSHTPSS